MKLLARILSHGFAIVVVLLLAVGLIYRGELFPEYDLPGFLDIGKLADQREASTTGPATGDDQEQITIQSAEVGSTDEMASGNDQAGDVTAAGSPQTVPAEPEVIEPETIEQTSSDIESAASHVMPEPETESSDEDSSIEAVVPVPDEDEQQHLKELPEATSPLMQEPTSTAAGDLAAVETMPEDVSESTDAAATQPESEIVEPQATDDAAVPLSKPQEKAYQLLAAAREAYWLRDYDVAESKYKDLTRLEPDNPDGYGELGNMYFSQGQWDEAATVYYEAGVRLVGQGLLDQAVELVAVIRGLNSARADDLELKINEARSAAD